jgi:uncharacterized membrane protein YjgN (DUF898 family)
MENNLNTALGISSQNSTISNSSFSKLPANLKASGYMVIGLGVISGLIILTVGIQSSGSLMLSKNDSQALAVVMSILVVFYHTLLGMLCLGMAALLERTNIMSASLNSANRNSSVSVSSPNYKKCSQCNKLYEASFSGEFCDQCGAKL